MISLEGDANKDATEKLIANVNASEGTQLVVSSSHGTYCRFDDVADMSSSKTSIYRAHFLGESRGLLFLL